MSPDGKSVRRDRFAVADAFEERVPGDDVFVFTCLCYRNCSKKKTKRKEVSARILVTSFHEKGGRLKNERERERSKLKKRTRTTIRN